MRKKRKRFRCSQRGFLEAVDVWVPAETRWEAYQPGSSDAGLHASHVKG